jgi:hypothetical protein
VKTEDVIVRLTDQRSLVAMQSLEHVVDPEGATCETDDGRPVAWLVSGLQLCEQCANAPDVRCTCCGWREAGKYEDLDRYVTCPICGHRHHVEAHT